MLHSPMSENYDLFGINPVLSAKGIPNQEK